LQAYATAFPDFRLVIDDLVADADKVAFRWTFNGTHRGPLADIRASGKQVSVSNNVGIFESPMARSTNHVYAGTNTRFCNRSGRCRRAAKRAPLANFGRCPA
jgi:SnoaL-like polyketide cyclase